MFQIQLENLELKKDLFFAKCRMELKYLIFPLCNFVETQEKKIEIEKALIGDIY